MVNFENGNIIDEDGFTTTFPSDFSIADRFGVNAIKDTFNRAFGEWKGHYKYLLYPMSEEEVNKMKYLTGEDWQTPGWE